MSCRHGELAAQAPLGIRVNECAGYSFPDVLYPHLAIVEQELAPYPPRRRRRRIEVPPD
jgi:hypothetical protein